MSTVLGVFPDHSRALNVIERLRAARFDTRTLRLIGGPDDVAEFATNTGAGADVSAGPPNAVLSGLVGSEVAEDELHALEQRLEAGAAFLLAQDLDDEAASKLRDLLQQQQAERVISA